MAVDKRSGTEGRYRALRVALWSVGGMRRMASGFTPVVLSATP